MSTLRAAPVAVQKYKPGLTLPMGHNLSTLKLNVRSLEDLYG